MNKTAALHNFFSSFGLKAYEEYAVPSGDDAPKFPYCTYSVSVDSFDRPVAAALSLWYRGTSWVPANAKAEEISSKIGRSGAFTDCDGGRIWIKRGSPFAQNMGDPEDDMIKRKYINLSVEFFTAD